MRRLTLFSLLFSLPILLSACTSEAAPPVDGPSGPSDSTEPAEETLPTLSLDDSRVGSRGLYVIKGKVENAKVPATFHLRTESGCSRDAKLHTSTIGIGYTLALDGADLADALGCAIDVEADGHSLVPIAVSPNAEAAGASKGLALDPSIALVSASLDPHPAHTVRFTVVSDHPLQSAHVDLDGRTYRATLAPLDATEGESTAIFEVPDGAWAEAVLAGSIAHVTTNDTNGEVLTIDVKPTVDVTLVGEDGDCDA